MEQSRKSRFLWFGGVVGVFLFLLSACNKGLRDDGVREKFSLFSPEYSFRLDTLVAEPWDMLLVLKPYRFMEIQKHEINMPKKVRKKLERISLHNEDMCVLLFVHNNTLVKYVPVHYKEFTDLNFAEVDTLDEGILPETVFILDSVGKVLISSR